MKIFTKGRALFSASPILTAVAAGIMILAAISLIAAFEGNAAADSGTVSGLVGGNVTDSGDAEIGSMVVEKDGGDFKYNDYDLSFDADIIAYDYSAAAGASMAQPDVSDNELTIVAGSKGNRYVVGGLNLNASDSTISVTDNAVKVTGNYTLGHDFNDAAWGAAQIIGGMAKPGDGNTATVTGNKVLFEADSANQATGDDRVSVYGAVVKGDGTVGGDTQSSGNEVLIDGGTSGAPNAISLPNAQHVIGAQIRSSEVVGAERVARYNSVKVTGEAGTLMVSGGLFGAEIKGGSGTELATGPKVQDNTVELEWGTYGTDLDGIVAGGVATDTTFATVKSNSVNFSGTATVNGDVIGGLAWGTGAGNHAEGNSVNIGGTATVNDHVFGAYVEHGTASLNFVNLTGGTVDNEVVGGEVR